MRGDETECVTLCFLQLNTEEMIFAFRANGTALNPLQRRITRFVLDVETVEGGQKYSVCFVQTLIGL